MSSAISRKAAELAVRIRAAAQRGDEQEVLEATNAMELWFAATSDQATPSERLAILGTCFDAYESIGEWELAALKLEDTICYAERHHRNSPETAADYAHLAEAYWGLGDTGAAVRAMEIAIGQMKVTTQWPEFGPGYERRVREMRVEHGRPGGRQALRNPELLRAPDDRVPKAETASCASPEVNAEGFPAADPQFDPVYVVAWQLSRLPNAEEASAIVWSFVGNGDLPKPDERTRLLRMSDTEEWGDANALPFQIVVHGQLKRSFPELSRYIRVSETGCERDERLSMETVTGVGTLGDPPSAPMKFRVVNVRPRASATQAAQPGGLWGRLSRGLQSAAARRPEPRGIKPK